MDRATTTKEVRGDNQISPLQFFSKEAILTVNVIRYETYWPVVKGTR